MPAHRNIEAFAAALRPRFTGEIHLDHLTRILYSTDASIYQMMPLAVILPRTAEDLKEAVRLAAAHGLPLLPRGSGTSLGGQAVGEAVVVDCSKYLTHVLELDAEGRRVRVEPGVILDELNTHLRPHGLMFAPDVATGNRASLGGMMGNNSCGAHSVIYGKTVDHVISQRVLLSDGSEALLSEVTAEEWSRRSRDGEGATLEARIYREVGRICEQHAEEIDRRFPRLMRRVGGYNLDEIVRHRRYNLARLVVGSEGTLTTIAEATLNLVPVPRGTALLVAHFEDLIEALEAVPLCLEMAPSAMELTDRIILNLTRQHPTLARAADFLRGDPAAILAVEFSHDPERGGTPLAERTHALEEQLRKHGFGYAYVQALDPAAQKDVWNARKAGLGLLMGMKGDRKPAGFMEDTAVPVDRLADYIRRFQDILHEHGCEASCYAHASVGCLHVRPILNLKSAADIRRMRAIAEAVSSLVLEYGGSLSAEHGDGLSRSEFQRKMFGPVVYEAFRDLKRAFDPHGRMNPGKIVDAPPMTENLRYGPGYQTIALETHFDFSRDGGFARHVELCSGVGACRKKLDGTMCPSYHATLDEAHSTRGRANALRAAIAGQLPGGFTDPALYEVLDLCLECKACKSECPSNVDMARLKAEFLAAYHAAHGTPLRARLFSTIHAMDRLLAPFAGLANAIMGTQLSRRLMARWLGVTEQRTLPRLAAVTFHRWWTRRPSPPHPDAVGTPRGRVALMADTFTNYHEPHIGIAAVRVLEALGYEVVVPPLKCCGRTLISKGFLRQARRLAESNVALLEGYARAGIPMLWLEPSCAAALADDTRDLVPGPASEAVAGATRLFEDFVGERHGEAGLPFQPRASKALLHGHCHQKALFGTQGARRALSLIPGLSVEEIPSGCCGMAGSFGYEAEHYELSLKIGELSLFPHIRAASEDALLVASGTSCRHQIQHACHRVARHPAEVLADALADRPKGP
ncbi:MAG: FAD-binding protein [Armatimonadetes bacterium]|nr:FAD-binding protein [Armatimonadota bacterium]